MLRAWRAALPAVLLAAIVHAQTTVLVTQTATVSPDNPVVTQSSARTVTASPGAHTATAVPDTDADPQPVVVPSLELGPAQVPFVLQRPQADNVAQPGFFQSCTDTDDGLVAPAQRLNVSALYLQLVPVDTPGVRERFQVEQLSSVDSALFVRMIGRVDATNHAYNDSTELLSSVVITTSPDTGTKTNSNATFLCDHIFPFEQDSLFPNVQPSSCQYGPGLVGIGALAPVTRPTTPSSLRTQVRVYDASDPAQLVSCITFSVVSLVQDYWLWQLIFWYPFALAVAVLALVSAARLLSAHSALTHAFRNKAREGSVPSFVRDRVYPVISFAVSGRQLTQYPALLRFVTPGFMDVVLYTQYVGALSMIAVPRPDSAYALAQWASWSMLVGIADLPVWVHDRQKISPTYASSPVPQQPFEDALRGTVASPMRMYPDLPSSKSKLMNLAGAKNGLSAYARAGGLQPNDAFWRCLLLWLIIVAALMAISFVAYMFAVLWDVRLQRAKQREEQYLAPMVHDTHEHEITVDELTEGSAKTRSRTLRRERRRARSSDRSLLRHNIHAAALHGNILRVLALFHLPLTLFAVYAFTSADRASTSNTTVAIAALAFVLLSVLFPSYIVLVLWRTPTQRLYEDRTTFHMYGPLYNTYAPGSELYAGVVFAHSLVVGTVIGVQRLSGNAQSIVLVAIEIGMLLLSTLWLPWGRGAMMWAVNFGVCVLRVAAAVLVALDMPLVHLHARTKAWFAYVMQLIHALTFIFFTVLCLIKCIELLLRIAASVPFDNDNSVRTTGLIGALGVLRRRRSAGPRRHSALPSKEPPAPRTLGLVHRPPDADAVRPAWAAMQEPVPVHEAMPLHEQSSANASALRQPAFDSPRQSGIAIRAAATAGTPELHTQEWGNETAPLVAPMQTRRDVGAGVLAHDALDDALPPTTARESVADSDSDESDFDEGAMWRTGPQPPEPAAPWTGVTRMRQALQSLRATPRPSIVRAQTGDWDISMQEFLQAGDERASFTASEEDVYWLPRAVETNARDA